MTKRKISGPKAQASPHDKLSSAFLEALEQDFQENGPALIKAMDPTKKCEIVARLIPVRPPAPVNGSKEPVGTREIAKQSLIDIGMLEEDITESDINLAYDAHEIYLQSLLDIKNLQVRIHDGDKPDKPPDKSA
jgi:hypothetical protein